MAAYRRVYDSRHLQADCQKTGINSGTIRSVIEYRLFLANGHFAAYTPMHEAAKVGGGPRDQEINSRSSETTPGADHGFESAKK